VNVTDTRPSQIADPTETWRERLAYWAYATIAWVIARASVLRSPVGSGIAIGRTSPRHPSAVS